MNRTPDESSGEGEDWTEWFEEKHSALERRKELIDEDPCLEDHRTGRDFAVYRVQFVSLPPKQLLFAVLNGAGRLRVQMVVEDYDPTDARRERDRIAAERDL